MISERTQKILDRFLSRVYHKNGCWEFSGFHDEKGYARMSAYDGEIRAHRISYRLFIGPIPEGLVVRHKCDNPGCVDYAHLEIGTHSDNVKDRDSRGRTARGFKIKHTKLSDDQVREIRRLWAERKIKQIEIAKMFNIEHGYAHSIATYRRRKHVK